MKSADLKAVSGDFVAVDLGSSLWSRVSPAWGRSEHSLALLLDNLVSRPLAELQQPPLDIVLV